MSFGRWLAFPKVPVLFIRSSRHGSLHWQRLSTGPFKVVLAAVGSLEAEIRSRQEGSWLGVVQTAFGEQSLGHVVCNNIASSHYCLQYTQSLFVGPY